MDSQKMTKDGIFKKYIQHFKSEESIGRNDKDMMTLMKKVLQYVKEDVLSHFKGEQKQKSDANFGLVSFFTANTKRPPAGNIKDLQGKYQRNPKYLHINSISKRQKVVDPGDTPKCLKPPNNFGGYANMNAM